MGHYLSKSAGLAAGGNTSTSQLQTSDSLYHIGRDDQQRPFRPFESFQIPLRVISPNRRPSLTPSFEVFMLEWFNSRQNRTPGPGDDRNHHVQLSYCCFKAYTQMFGRWMGSIDAATLPLHSSNTWQLYSSLSIPSMPLQFPAQVKTEFDESVAFLLQGWFAEVRTFEYARDANSNFHDGWVVQRSVSEGAITEVTSSQLAGLELSEIEPRESSIVQLESLIQAIAFERLGYSVAAKPLDYPYSHTSLSTWLFQLTQNSELRAACCDLSDKSSQFLQTLIVWLFTLGEFSLTAERMDMVELLLGISTWSSRTPNVLCLSIPPQGKSIVTYHGYGLVATHSGHDVLFRIPNLNESMEWQNWHFANRIRRVQLLKDLPLINRLSSS